MSRRVYETIIEGRSVTHIPNSNADFATLCLIDDGLAGEAPGVGNSGYVTGVKINCAQCKSIWTRATQYRASDFSSQTI